MFITVIAALVCFVIYANIFMLNVFLKNLRYVVVVVVVEYVRTGEESDFWHVQDQSRFSNPYVYQTIGHRGY